MTNHRPPVIELIDPHTAEVLRRMSPAQRLANGHAMWRYAYERCLTIVRHRHPDWDEQQVRAEVGRRMNGAG